jgi:hypothetical protein
MKDNIFDVEFIEPEINNNFFPEDISNLDPNNNPIINSNPDLIITVNDIDRKPSRRIRKNKIDNDFIILSSGEDYEELSAVNSMHISLNGDSFKCYEPECGKEFEYSFALKKHIITHGIKSFECSHPFCGKKFIDNSKLRRHSLVHTVGIFLKIIF